MSNWLGSGVAIILAAAALAVSLLALSRDSGVFALPELEGPASKAEPGRFTRAFVDQAIARHDAEGREPTIEFYKTKESVDGEWYVFIVGEDDHIIAHPTIPENIGQDLKGLLGTDITGYNFGAEMLAANEEGRWVDYTYLNPARRNQQETKHSWVVRHHGLLFGSGWYERSPYSATVSKDEPAAFTKAFVESAITYYASRGRDATLDYYNSKDSVDGEWYIFIVGEDDRVIAHATVPENIGQDLKGDLGTDINGYVFGDKMLATTEEGRWVDYVYLNPARENRQETKHSWVVRHDGLLFGAGWYEVNSITHFLLPPGF